MQPMAPKIIKSTKFEDGTFRIAAPLAPVAFAPIGDHAPSADPGVTAAEAEARAILAAAREEAEALVLAARQQVEAIKQEALEQLAAMKANALHEGAAEGHQSGLSTGLAEGREAVLAQHAGLLSQIAQAAADATQERRRWYAAQEQDVVTLSLLIAQKILLSELATSRQSVTAMAAAALARVTDKTRVRLRVHPDDLALVLEAKPALLNEIENLTELEVVPDGKVGLGGCLIETRTGRVDARLSTQLTELASTLLELPPGASGAFAPPLAEAIAELAPQAPAPYQPAPRTVDLRAPAAPRLPTAPVPVQAEAHVPAAPLPEPLGLPVTEAPPARLPEAEQVVPAAQPPVEPALVPEAPVASEPAAPQWPSFEAAAEAIAGLAPTASEPLVAGEWPLDPAAPAATAPSARPVDPSRRAAEALALRLGQLKRGRGITTLGEEYDMSLLEGAMSDDELGAIVRSVLPRATVESGVDRDKPLVYIPPDLSDAADALAERLGKKKKNQPWYSRAGVADDGPSDREIEELHSALGDDTIDQILRSAIPVVPSAEGLAEASEPKRPASVEEVMDSLADRLGQKKNKVRPWYTKAGVSEDGPTEREIEELHSALGDDTIDQIFKSAAPAVPPAPGNPTGASALEPPSLDRVTDNLNKLLGKKKSGRHPWHQGLD